MRCSRCSNKHHHSVHCATWCSQTQQWDAFFTYEQIRAADAPGGTLPNPFPKSVGAELHFPKQTKSWWQQRFGFIIFSHSNSPCRAQICCVALSEISLFRDHLWCQSFVFPVTWCLTSDSCTACHLISDLSSFHWSCRMIVFVHRSRFSARRLIWVKWLRSVDPKATSNTNQVWWERKGIVRPKMSLDLQFLPNPSSF